MANMFKITIAGSNSKIFIYNIYRKYEWRLNYEKL